MLFENHVLAQFSLGQALNAPDLLWTNTGSISWISETTTTHDGIAAATVLATSSQTANLETAVVGLGTLTFWSAVSASSSASVLNCYIDNFSVTGVTGLVSTVSWKQQTAYVSSGNHILTWKLQAGHFGSATGYVDQVAYAAGGTAPIVTFMTPNQTVTMSKNTFLIVFVVGTPPFTYQWQFKGINIPNETNATLFLTNVNLSNAGNYTVGVTNDFGGIATNVVLTVLPFQFNFSKTNTSMSSNGFQMTLTNIYAPNSIVIYASTNLIDWQPIFTNPPTAGTLKFLDSAATNLPMQFYRAVEY
jgi:Immunoglobulin I-set domain